MGFTGNKKEKNSHSHRRL